MAKTYRTKIKNRNVYHTGTHVILRIYVFERFTTSVVEGNEALRKKRN